MDEVLPTKYKGLPLDRWKSPKLLAALTTEEMYELHCLLQMHLIEDVERRLRGSDFAESKYVISRVINRL